MKLVKNHNQDNLTVVRHNFLMTASYSLNLDEHRLVLSAIAQIDPRKPVPDEIKIRAVDFAHHWGLDRDSCYTQLKKARDGLLKQTIRLPQLSNGEVWDILWIDGAGVHDGKGYIKLSFHHKIKDYLSGFDGGNYTSAKIMQFRKLKVVHSFRILGMVVRFDRFEDGCGYYTTGVDNLKEMLGLKNKYPTWNDFNRYVIKKVVKDINATTNYTVKVETEKRARKVVKINMLFTPNEQPDMFKEPN